jgi:hypothetical protein
LIFFDVYFFLTSCVFSFSSSLRSAVSIFCAIFVLFLFVSEFLFFLTPEQTSEMFVDNNNLIHAGLVAATRLPPVVSHRFVSGNDHATLHIIMNFTLPAVPCAGSFLPFASRFPFISSSSLTPVFCSVVSVDAQDIMGGHIVDVGGELHKVRVSKETLFPLRDANGNPLPIGLDSSLLSLFLPPFLLKALVVLFSSDSDPLAQKGEGCNVNGYLIVKRVPGNFHVSAHAHAHLLNAFFGNDPMNLTSVLLSSLLFSPFSFRLCVFFSLSGTLFIISPLVLWMNLLLVRIHPFFPLSCQLLNSFSLLLSQTLWKPLSIL